MSRSGYYTYYIPFPACSPNECITSVPVVENNRRLERFRYWCCLTWYITRWWPYFMLFFELRFLTKLKAFVSSEIWNDAIIYTSRTTTQNESNKIEYFIKNLKLPLGYFLCGGCEICNKTMAKVILFVRLFLTFHCFEVLKINKMRKRYIPKKF